MAEHDQTPVALTIAGSDSSGGAGIQADLKTFTALGVYGASVLTALTAQNTRGVTAIHAVPAQFVTQQIDAVAGDLRVAAVKTGMLYDRATVLAVVAGVRRHKLSPLVVDPVMVATSGDMLLEPDAVEAVRRELLPLADIVTPNLPEAARLLHLAEAADEAEMEARRWRCWRWAPRPCCSRAATGAGARRSTSSLRAKAVAVRLALPRIDTRNTHGTGCTLSAAIAAGLAQGESLTAAVGAAKRFVHAALIAARTLKIGGGSGPVDHLHTLRDHGKS